MNWIEFDPYGYLPPERRYVLVQRSKGELTAAGVHVGYLRVHSNGPFFVTPGSDANSGPVVAWNDCLGDDFKPPLWVLGQPE